MVVLTLIKDFINEGGGIKKTKLTRNLLRFCKRVRERYEAFFEQQKKVEEHMKLARVKEELAKQTKDVVSELENEMRFLKKVIEIVETSVKEGNHELRETMKRKALN